jgi:hypothetical protein
MKNLYLKAAILIFVPIIILFVLPVKGVGYFIAAIIALLCVITGIVLALIGTVRSFKKATKK